jgi:CDP-diacylglycerol---glycerol-3-phosphate 3-phosphatidyltransferase
MAEMIVRPLALLHVTPNTVTIVGLFLNGVVGWVIAGGHLVSGGILLLVAGGFDMLDGALARVTKKFSTFGAFLDSVLDRYSEAIVGFGLLYHEMLAHDTLVVGLLYAYIIGSLMISYARARAEGLGLDAKVGLLPRPERIVILAVGLIFHVLLVPVLVILAILTNFTALQRVYHVWQGTRSNESDSSAPSSS